MTSAVLEGSARVKKAKGAVEERGEEEDGGGEGGCSDGPTGLA